MLVYRLGVKQYIRDLSGTGARLYGGRWNHKGTSLLYTSQHCSLALLEVIVNTPQKLMPPNLQLLKLDIPDNISTITLSRDNLPENWRQYPAPDVLADIGSDWVAQNESVAFRVPSVLVPNEWNILLNPEHSLFSEISIKSISPFSIDLRF